MSVLSLIILLPILAATAIFLGVPARRTALAASGANLLLSVWTVLSYRTAGGGWLGGSLALPGAGGGKFQFLGSFPIVPEWDFKYFVGADGLSLVLILLTAAVTMAAIWVTPKIERQANAFYGCLLLIAAGAFGAFASLDLIFFYAFHELALIPTFLLIGIWGFGDRQAAAWKITIYLALGSFVLLVGLIGLYQMVPMDLRTFDIPKLQELAAAGKLDLTSSNWVYLSLLIGFGILISLFPFHSWAPSAYASAPTPAAMLHAGVLKKFGLYGLLRVALPMLPEAAQQWTNLLLVLLLGNILYVGLVTIAQKRLDLMLGYSSVMHMGYIFLGLATLNQIGISGASLLMFAHGLSIAALFAVAGEVRERTGTLTFNQLGGLARTMPFAGLTFGIAAFASIGLPGFANFASEIMVFFGAYKSGHAFQLTMIGALWGVVISAVYMLRGYRASFQGELNPRWKDLGDLACSSRWAVILLLALLLVGGFYPQFFLNLLVP